MGKVTKQKDAVCVGCGKVIQINVLASLKTAKCDECKGGKRQDVPRETDGEEAEHTTAYGESLVGPRIDGKPNRALARLCCPYHPHRQMDIIGVIKNDHWGDIVSMQCRERGCWTVVQISEQARNVGPWRTTVDGTSFEPDDLLGYLNNGRMNEWADEHDVEVKHTKGL